MTICPINDLGDTEEENFPLLPSRFFDAGSYKKQRIQKTTTTTKTNYFCFIDYAKGFDCVDHNKPEYC